MVANLSTAQPLAARDFGKWAQPVARLSVGELPSEAINANVHGRRVTSPVRGFGQLWRKTYRIALAGATASPAGVIAVWKREYGSFWPKGNGFYASSSTIAPGEIAVLNLKMFGPLKLSTGVFVAYADDTSFCFLTPEGHMYAGLILFSAEAVDGTTVAQVQALIRASDPLFEISNRLGIGHMIEDRFWRQTLANLATRFGVAAQARQQNELLDGRMQWAEWPNVRHNAAIHTMLYLIGAPLRRRRGDSSR